LKSLRIAPVVCLVLAVVGVLGTASPASAASCPTQVYLSFDHLAYAAVSVPATVKIPAGVSIGHGTVDEPISSNGCKRRQASVRVLRAGSVEPPVAVLVSGRAGTVFVIGQRCTGFTGTSYWDCLLKPLIFKGQQFTATSYPSSPAPRRTMPFGVALGTAEYHGRRITVRRILGVSPSLAVGISGQPSTAFLSPRTCPYSGFSNTPQYDNLLRCLRSPVWFTFDPPGSDDGGTVVARSDRPIPSAVAGATISLVALPVVADFVPANHGPLVRVGSVSAEVRIHVPNLPAGLYEAVVSAGTTLHPAGSILVTKKSQSSLAIKIISYTLLVAFAAAVILTIKTRRRRVGMGSMLGRIIMGPPAGARRGPVARAPDPPRPKGDGAAPKRRKPGRAGSSRRGRS
jgi:hypothetical protein